MTLEEFKEYKNRPKCFYTKEEIQEILNDISQKVIVDILPTEGQENYLYLVPSTVNPGTYEQYTWKNNNWEYLGNVDEIQYTDYVTNPEMDLAFDNLKTINNQSLLEGGNLTILEEELPNKIYDPSNFSGLGRKYLQKNIVNEKNVLTQTMMQNSNTIYIIQYDYNLNGVSITVPSGCVLQFEGGSLSNGTLVGDKTLISAGNYQIFSGISFTGSWNGDLNACWVGAKMLTQDFDNSVILQSWLDSYKSCFPIIRWPRSSYYFKSECSITTDNNASRGLVIDADNSNFLLLIEDDSNGDGKYFLKVRPERFTIKNLRLTNTSKTTVGGTTYNLSKTRGIFLDKAQLFMIENVTMYYFDIAVHLQDVYYGTFTRQCSFMKNRIGIFTTPNTSSEVNTVDFHNIRLSGIDSSYVTVVQAIYPQESGESEDNYSMRIASCGVDFHTNTNNCKFYGMVIEGFDYGMRFNWIPRSSDGTAQGLINIDSCYFEGNANKDIYIADGYLYNKGSLTKVLRVEYITNITNCLFHVFNRSANILVSACIVYIYGCKGDYTPVLYNKYDSKLQNTITFDGTLSIVGDQLCTIIRKGTQRSAYQTNGSFTASLQNRKTCFELGMQNEFNTLFPVRAQNNGGVSMSTNLYYNVASANDRRVFRTIPNLGSVGMLPTLGMKYYIYPYNCKWDVDSGYKVEVPCGSMMFSAMADADSVLSVCSSNLGIPLSEFLRRWNAGTSYTGYVNQVFLSKISADPSTGLIRRIDIDGDTGKETQGRYVGFGKAAIDGNYSWATSGSNYINVDTLCVARYKGSGVFVFVADIVQCGRTYREILREATIDNASSNYNKCMKFIATTVEQGDGSTWQSIMRHQNAIYYNLDEQKYKIFDGYAWVDLSSVSKRYNNYKAFGKSKSECIACPEFAEMRFYNYATGINYVARLSPSGTRAYWETSLGSVISLEHPNGYDATNNPLDYATELVANEQVLYQGKVYTWTGTAFELTDNTISNIETLLASI